MHIKLLSNETGNSTTFDHASAVLYHIRSAGFSLAQKFSRALRPINKTFSGLQKNFRSLRQVSMTKELSALPLALLNNLVIDTVCPDCCKYVTSMIAVAIHQLDNHICHTCGHVCTCACMFEHCVHACDMGVVHYATRKW